MLDYHSPFLLTSIVLALICWSSAYVIVIRRGLIDKSYGMPVVPLCVNLSYELIFGFIYPDKPPVNLVNILWFLFDLGIVYTYLEHGRAEWPPLLPRPLFLVHFLLVLSLSFTGVLAVTFHFDDWTGSLTGWGDNFLIFSSLLAMLLRRGSTRGQSIYVAILTWIGSIVLIPVEMRISPGSLILNYLYVGFVVLGSLYIVLLYRAFRAEGKNPWTIY